MSITTIQNYSLTLLDKTKSLRDPISQGSVKYESHLPSRRNQSNRLMLKSGLKGPKSFMHIRSIMDLVMANSSNYFTQ